MVYTIWYPKPPSDHQYFIIKALTIKGSKRETHTVYFVQGIILLFSSSSTSSQHNLCLCEIVSLLSKVPDALTICAKIICSVVCTPEVFHRTQSKHKHSFSKNTLKQKHITVLSRGQLFKKSPDNLLPWKKKCAYKQFWIFLILFHGWLYHTSTCYKNGEDHSPD